MKTWQDPSFACLLKHPIAWCTNWGARLRLFLSKLPEQAACNYGEQNRETSHGQRSEPQ